MLRMRARSVHGGRRRRRFDRAPDWPRGCRRGQSLDHGGDAGFNVQRVAGRARLPRPIAPCRPPHSRAGCHDCRAAAIGERNIGRTSPRAALRQRVVFGRQPLPAMRAASPCRACTHGNITPSLLEAQRIAHRNVQKGRAVDDTAALRRASGQSRAQSRLLAGARASLLCRSSRRSDALNTPSRWLRISSVSSMSLEGEPAHVDAGWNRRGATLKVAVEWEDCQHGDQHRHECEESGAGRAVCAPARCHC